MEVLYLSHCVPNPPDKGERIRAFHEIRHLSERHNVHVACFARSSEEEAAAAGLAQYCASVYVERRSVLPALAGAAVRFALGASLTSSYFASARLREYVAALARRVPFAAAIAYSGVMGSYAPAGVPLLLDLVDVDSEKWLQYAAVRRPSLPYALEGRRLRRLESELAGQAHCTLLATRQESDLFRSFAPGATIDYMENGVDFDFFDPRLPLGRPELAGRPFLAFVGVMNYYPNAVAACAFAQRVFPALRERRPDLELFLVGRDPSSAVSRLAAEPGVTVTGSVPDVRPYLLAAQAVVAPLQIARGIQNKVLEALAMGKQVFASPAVCDTFGSPLPKGVVCCHTSEQYAGAVVASNVPDVAIRDDARQRFSWQANMDFFSKKLEAAVVA